MRELIKTNRLENGAEYYEYAVGSRKRVVGVVSIHKSTLISMISWIKGIW